jgi:hypothetical protein
MLLSSTPLGYPFLFLLSLARSLARSRARALSLALALALAHLYVHTYTYGRGPRIGLCVHVYTRTKGIYTYTYTRQGGPGYGASGRLTDLGLGDTRLSLLTAHLLHFHAPLVVLRLPSSFDTQVSSSTHMLSHTHPPPPPHTRLVVLGLSLLVGVLVHWLTCCPKNKKSFTELLMTCPHMCPRAHVHTNPLCGAGMEHGAGVSFYDVSVRCRTLTLFFFA